MLPAGFIIKNQSKGLVNMDNKNNIEELEMYREQVKDLFKETSTTELYDEWSDAFEIMSIDENRILLTYHGTEPIKKFKKECMEVIKSCIYSVIGDGRKIKITKKTIYSELSPNVKKNIRAAKFFVIGMVFVCIATAVIIMMGNYIGNRNFRETFYNVSNIKVDSPLRVIQLSDLHGVSYGKNNSKLIKRIKELKPDIIICTGDMVDSATEDIDFAVSLARELQKIAPSYYVYGNNEVESIYDFELSETALDEKFGFNADNRNENTLSRYLDAFERKIEAVGMKVLKNEKDTIKIKTMTVDIYGVLNSNPSSFWSYSGTAFAEYIYENPDNLKITAVHEPFIFEELEEEFWGDLMVSGHTHGGVIRIPVLGPLFTNEGGLLPERNGAFVYGRYDVCGKPLIVSAGLENSNILRINNEPELVVIDINKF